MQPSLNLELESQSTENFHRGFASDFYLVALSYALLIIYASLYPFGAWRDQGLFPFAFLISPWPQYWTWLELLLNVLGYVPLGLFSGLAILRSHEKLKNWGKPFFLRTPQRGLFFVSALGCLLCLLLETAQMYLRTRIASNLDFAMNMAGLLFGVFFARRIHANNILNKVDAYRMKWFAADNAVVLVGLTLWPLALLMPLPSPFGLGQISEQFIQILDAGVQALMALMGEKDWPTLSTNEVREASPSSTVLAVSTACGLVAPSFMLFTVLRKAYRIHGLVCLLSLGLLFEFISYGLHSGAANFGTWLNGPMGWGVLLGLVCCFLGLHVNKRLGCVVALCSLCIQLSVLNLASPDPYLRAAIQSLQQSRYFYLFGLLQWLAWLWPYAGVAYLAHRLIQTPETR